MPEVPVKVFVRVRPLLKEEQLRSHDLSVTCIEKDQLMVGGNRLFRFDHVFPPTATQDEVYSAVVSPLVQTFISGINCTVFAYGQTSSGKTYTLGSDTLASPSSDSCGIIFRAIEEIFEALSKQQESNGDKEGVVGGGREESGRSEVRVSYIEVYKEEVRDLISEGSPETDIVHIREDEAGHTVVAGVTEEVVCGVEEALSWLETGSISRVTSSTAMNEHSSRSHAIFTVTLDQQQMFEQKCDSGQVVCMEQRVVSKFHFVDLAGSERVNRTANKGERFIESVHINSGLLALGNVISALADPRRRNGHIPYRDSKITRLLKDSLGGSARTVMITCLSPARENVGESLNALKYAKRARSIKNRPVVNRDPQTTIMAAMEKEIHTLRAELQRAHLSSVNTMAPSIDSSRSRVDELPSVDAHIQSLREELELSHTHQQQLQSKLCLARKQLMSIVDSKQMPESHSALESVLALLVCDLGESTSEGITPHYNQATPEKRLSRAMETIELLRRELESCKRDLMSDEEIFTEKMTELKELEVQVKLATDRSDQAEEEIERLKRRESELCNKLEEQTDTITDLKQQLCDVTVVKPAASHGVSSASVQTVGGNGSTEETISNTMVESSDGDGSSGHVHSALTTYLLCFSQDLTEESCDTALRTLTSILAQHKLDVTPDHTEPERVPPFSQYPHTILPLTIVQSSIPP